MGNKKKVALACYECGSRNYTITENPNRVTQRDKVIAEEWFDWNF